MTGPRSMQAHKSVKHDGVRGLCRNGRRVPREQCQILIGWLGVLDLQKERSGGGHVAETDGQDSKALDGPGFPQECFF
jgi:hypothetical protein